MDEWIEAVKEELGITSEVDVDEQLELARVAAHRVERRAAPVTTFLVGLAAGRAGGGDEEVGRAAAAVMELARKWG